MFLVFIGAVALMNVYDWWRIKSAFLSRSSWGAYALLLLILTVLFMPMFINRSSLPFARVISQTGWIWLAWSFWLASAFFAMDLLNLAVGAVSHLVNREVFIYPWISPFVKGCIAMGIVVAATVWGVTEAYAIKVKEVKICSPFAPEKPYRAAFVSDIHLGSACSWRKLRKIKSKLDEINADLILNGGDMADGRGAVEEKMAAELNAVSTKKRLAVYGNHEVYTGLEYSRKLYGMAGFTLLENDHEIVDEWLHVYGVTDPANGAASDLPDAPENCFSILLSHRPSPRTGKGYSLQLSGHSHGGQIFPFNFLIRLQHPYREGKVHELSGGTKFYVSPGTGVWGPPFRLFARPEITVFSISSEKEVQK